MKRSTVKRILLALLCLVALYLAASLVYSWIFHFTPDQSPEWWDMIAHRNGLLLVMSGENELWIYSPLSNSDDEFLLGIKTGYGIITPGEMGTWND